MATIKTAIALYDGVTAPLQHMTRAMNIVLNSFESMQSASGHAVDTSAIKQAREELARTETALDGIETSIRNNDQQQQRFNSSIRAGTSSADGLLSKLKGMAATIGGMIGIQKVIGLSDTLASANARLNLIVDDGGSVEELKNKVMASANEARASYVDVVKTVSKLGILAGKAFANNDEMIKFTELMNKNFVIGGASLEEQTSSMYQLTQAMAAGKLQGDEFRSIQENAPLLAQAITDYMHNAGVEGSLKDWAAQGLLTADVIKQAMFLSADEVDARFDEMPMTWAQRWVLMKNAAIQVFEPILNKINQIANSEQFDSVFNGIINGLAAIAKIATLIFGVMITIASGIINNWSWIEPIIWGIVAAMIVYNATAGIGWLTTLKNIAAKVAHAVASWAETAAILALIIAQEGFNAALMACPLTWIIMLIIVLIAIFYAAVKAVNHFAGTSISATGIIVGAFLVMAAAIGNILIGLMNAMIQWVWTIFVEPFLGIIEWVLNVTNGGFNSFGDAVANLIGQIISWFLSLGKIVTKIIDAILGTDWTAGLSSLQDRVLSWGKNENAITLDRKSPTINHRFEYGAAWNAGNNFGKGIEDKISGLFNFENTDSLGANDFANTLDDIYGNGEDTAGNTEAMRDSLDLAEEDLSYLRDIAEREAINRFTTAEISLVMNNNNNIASDVDLDGIINILEERVEETLVTAAEGVHV